MVSQHSQPRVASVDRIIRALGFYVAEEYDMGQDELEGLDFDGRALLGDLFLNWRTSAEYGCSHCEPEGTSVLGLIMDWAIHYSHSGPDREIAERLAEWYVEYRRSEALLVEGGAA